MKRILLWGLAGFVAIIFGVACAGGPSGSDKPDPTPAPPKAGTITNGTYEVGKDIKAGTYKTTVPKDSINCYWQRSSSSDDVLDSIIANDNQSAGAHVVVTIKSSDKQFKTDGCGTWALQK